MIFLVGAAAGAPLESIIAPARQQNFKHTRMLICGITPHARYVFLNSVGAVGALYTLSLSISKKSKKISKG